MTAADMCNTCTFRYHSLPLHVRLSLSSMYPSLQLHWWPGTRLVQLWSQSPLFTKHSPTSVNGWRQHQRSMVYQCIPICHRDASLNLRHCYNVLQITISMACLTINYYGINVPMHLMPASCVWSHMCTPRRELQSSTRCSSPLQASWSRKMGPTPWPKLAPRNANVPERKKERNTMTLCYHLEEKRWKKIFTSLNISYFANMQPGCK